MSVCSICGLPKCFPDEYHKQQMKKYLGTPVKRKPKKDSRRQ